MTNKNAGAVSEAELRTNDLSHILGEQENLTPGLSGGFALSCSPARTSSTAPGGPAARHLHRHREGQGLVWKSKSVLTAAVSGYATYVNQNVAGLDRLHPDLVRRHHRRQPDQAELALPADPRLLRADRAGGRGLGHARHRYRRPDRQPGDHSGRPQGLPPARRCSCGRTTRSPAPRLLLVNW